jgi:hypothetical protein
MEFSPFLQTTNAVTIHGMSPAPIPYTPSFDDGTIGARLCHLLVPGSIGDADLAGRIDRLSERFRIYAACYPLGLWAPGLVLTHEMRALTEQYLPLAEIRCALERLFARALQVPPVLVGVSTRRATTWLDLLHQLHPLIRHPDPSRLLTALLADEEARRRFLWGTFLPSRYGCGFDRYPGQEAFLRHWLPRYRSAHGAVRCLDAACGTGEGAYDLVRLLFESMGANADWHVDGVTLEPLELFSAAHGYFPHDPVRQAAFRTRVGPLLDMGLAERISFMQGDVTGGSNSVGSGYAVIVCNGLLGGPLLFEERRVAMTVAGLAEHLLPEGILLVADRFHGGWKKRITTQHLTEILASCGLQPQPAGEGIAGVRKLL